MAEVRRFTTDYVPVEDRVRLSVERGDGSVRILWLTQPLLDKLAARLVGVVDAAPRPKGDRARPGKGAGMAQQRFTQQAAEASIKPQAPVRAGTFGGQAGVAVLVTAIDLRETGWGLALDFKGGAQVLETIPFSGAALRQWLGVLYRNYCRAGWGGDFWPGWISADHPQANAARLN